MRHPSLDAVRPSMPSTRLSRCTPRAPHRTARRARRKPSCAQRTRAPRAPKRPHAARTLLASLASECESRLRLPATQRFRGCAPRDAHGARARRRPPRDAPLRTHPRCPASRRLAMLDSPTLCGGCATTECHRTPRAVAISFAAACPNASRGRDLFRSRVPERLARSRSLSQPRARTPSSFPPRPYVSYGFDGGGGQPANVKRRVLSASHPTAC